MELSDKGKAECALIAEGMGLAVAEIEKAVLDLMTNNGFPEMGALAVYKSTHKRELSAVRGAYRFIPLHVGPKQTVTTDGGEKEVVHVLGMCNLTKGTDFHLLDIGLWDPKDPDGKRVDRTKMASGLELDRVYEFDGAYNPANRKMSVLGSEFRLIPSIKVEMGQLMEGVEKTSISNAEDKLLEPGFYSGYVGSVYNGDTSGMLEISDMKALPITSWFNGESFDKTTYMGKKVVILGVPTKPKDKDIRLNGKRVWLVG